MTLSGHWAHLVKSHVGVSVRVESGGEGLMSALPSLHSSGIQIDDIAMRQPNLDEVFLALTGKSAEDNDDATAAHAA